MDALFKRFVVLTYRLQIIIMNIKTTFPTISADLKSEKSEIMGKKVSQYLKQVNLKITTCVDV